MTTPELIIEGLKTPAVWVVLVLVIIIMFRQPLRAVIDRMSEMELSAGAFSLKFKQAAAEAGKEKGATLSEQEIDALGTKAVRARRWLRGARILWIDDNPQNNQSHVRALELLGIRVDLATNSSAASAMLGAGKYDLVLSDIARAEGPDGLTFLNAQWEQGKLTAPVIFYVGKLTAQPLPPYIAGMANRPDVLFDLISRALAPRQTLVRQSPC